MPRGHHTSARSTSVDPSEASRPSLPQASSMTMAQRKVKVVARAKAAAVEAKAEVEAATATPWMRMRRKRQASQLQTLTRCSHLNRPKTCIAPWLKQRSNRTTTCCQTCQTTASGRQLIPSSSSAQSASNRTVRSALFSSLIQTGVDLVQVNVPNAWRHGGRARAVRKYSPATASLRIAPRTAIAHRHQPAASLRYAFHTVAVNSHRMLFLPS